MSYFTLIKKKEKKIFPGGLRFFALWNYFHHINKKERKTFNKKRDRKKET